MVEETIRLYPPIAAISRVALDRDELNGERVRPGSLIVISPYVLHRHRLLWDRPDEFDPRRFLGAAHAAIDRFAYLPFGAGPRVCVGASLALTESALVLATVAQRFRFSLVSSKPVKAFPSVTLRPRNGLMLRVERRD